MLDIACGDMTWLLPTHFPEGFVESGRYLGADVSPFIVNQNIRRLSTGEGGLRFVVLDAVDGDISAVRVHGARPELILCRHMVCELEKNTHSQLQSN